MNRTEKLKIAAAVVAITWAVAEYIRTTRRARKETASIENTIEIYKQIEAMRIAQGVVTERIRNGYYGDNLTLERIQEDFKFEQIAARFED